MAPSQIGRVAAGIFWRRCRVAARRRPIDTLFNRKRLSEEQIGHTVKARYARAATQQWWLRPHWSLVICEVLPIGGEGGGAPRAHTLTSYLRWFRSHVTDNILCGGGDRIRTAS